MLALPFSVLLSNELTYVILGLHMAKKEVDSYAKKTLETLFKHLQITADVEVTESKTPEGEPVISVLIESAEAGLLIGSHGATLLAIQSFLGMAIREHTGEWVRVSVDVSGWKEKHEDYLVSLAKQAIQRARNTGEPQHLYNLTPAQRRIIHTALSEETDMVSESLGEGDDRYLVVRLK